MWIEPVSLLTDSSPDMPREGRDRQAHYEQIFGEERAAQIMASMRDSGTEEGIEFGNKPGARSPKTLLAHALMLYAKDADGVDQTVLAEKLFHAHHVDCDDIGDLEVLLKIATDSGMDSALVRTALESETLEHEVTELISQSVERGVSGVPFFIINSQYGISGAQPADSLIAAFDQISAAG